MKKVKNKRLLAAVVAAAMAMTAVPIGLSAMAAEPEENEARNEQTLPQLVASGVSFGNWSGTAALLYPDGTLVHISSSEGSIGSFSSSKVADNVERVQTAIWDSVYNSYVGNTSYWDHYLIQDKDNSLWSWGMDDGKSEKIADNIVDYAPSAALLGNGNLIDTNKPYGVLLQNVQKIVNVIRDHATDYVYALQDNGNLTRVYAGYDYNSGAPFKGQVKIDSNVSSLLNDAVYIKDNATYSLDSQAKLADFAAVDAIYTGGCFYLVNQNGALYESIPAVSPYADTDAATSSAEVKLLTKEFDRFYYQNDWATGYVTKSGEAYHFNGSEMELPFPANEITIQVGDLYLKTDGTLWRENIEQLLTSVADIDGDFVLRTDGSLWWYGDSSTGFKEVVRGNGSLIDPVEPSTEQPTTPSTDGSAGTDDGKTPSDSSGNNGNTDPDNASNPSTGDSVIALAAGTLAAAAAGALLITRKKSGK